ncbi:MAG TPA: hypothetical protein VK817_01170 [Trebonia sp.]|jgi:hypothetical protein|nr:hypothetical protein [Trebonia sp.]
MSQPEANTATRDMGSESTAPARTILERPTEGRAWSRGRPLITPVAEFERVYLCNVDVLMGYFARRCADPHTVADLTSETFVRAALALGVSGVAFRKRLSRATARLRKEHQTND